MTLSLPYRRADLSIAGLAFVHAVGLLGMFSAWKDWFVAMSPVTLLLSASVLLLNHRSWNWNFTIASAAFLLLGYGVEVLGVATGAIFGEYSYGATLGPQLLDVPLLIGVNWLMLVYCTGTIGARLAGPGWLRALAGAALMTGLDLLIEPIAMKYDYWDWAAGGPPFQNYLAWFCVSFLLLLVFHYASFSKQNKVALALYIIQLLFFAFLNLLV